MDVINNFLEDENGVTAIEYALLGGLIAVVVAISITLMSTQVMQMFTTIAQEMVNLTKQ